MDDWLLAVKHEADAKKINNIEASLKSQSTMPSPTDILCTDVSQDGTMQGANVALYKRLVDAYPTQQWQASGGVHTTDNVAALARCGVAGVVLGKALLTGAFDLQQARAAWQHALQHPIPPQQESQ